MGPDIFETFKKPWKIKRHTSGNYRIEDRNGRVICWVYLKGNDTANHKKPSDEEALSGRVAQHLGYSCA